MGKQNNLRYIFEKVTQIFCCKFTLKKVFGYSKLNTTKVVLHITKWFYVGHESV